MLNFILVAVMLTSIIYVIIIHFNKNQKMLYKLSTTDYLTKVYSRRYLIEHIEKLVSESVHSGNNFQLLLIDINRFKSINDTYGHLVGDQILEKLGEVLNMEIEERDVCGRYGGDEFIVVLENVNIDETNKLVEKIRSSFQHSVHKLP